MNIDMDTLVRALQDHDAEVGEHDDFDTIFERVGIEDFDALMRLSIERLKKLTHETHGDVRPQTIACLLWAEGLAVGARCASY